MPPNPSALSCVGLWEQSAGYATMDWKRKLARPSPVPCRVEARDEGLHITFPSRFLIKASRLVPRTGLWPWSAFQRVMVHPGILASQSARATVARQDTYAGIAVVGVGHGTVFLPLVAEDWSNVQVQTNDAQHAARELLERDELAARWLALFRSSGVRFWPDA